MDKCLNCGGVHFAVKVMYEYSVAIHGEKVDLNEKKKHISSLACCDCDTEYYDHNILQNIKEALK